MKAKKISWFGLFFWMPAVLMSFLAWNGYRDELRTMPDPNPSVSGIYFLDEGRKVAVLSDVRQGEIATQMDIADADTGEPLGEGRLTGSNFGRQAEVSYQGGGFVFPTYDNESRLLLNLITPSGDPAELSEGALWGADSTPGGLNSWRGQLLLTGETEDSVRYIAQLADGKLELSLLTNPEPFPSRVTRSTFVPESLDNRYPFPVLELDLKDGSYAHAAGIIAQGQPAAVRLSLPGETTFAARDAALLQFTDELGLDGTQVIRERTDFPAEAWFYDSVTGDWGDKVPTPEPVYQARVFPLNERETLIAGSTAEDELAGEVTGYLYNEENGTFTDVSPLLGQLDYEDLSTFNGPRFFKETGSAVLYFSDGGSDAGWLDTERGAARLLNVETAKGWLWPPLDRSPTWNGFFGYVIDTPAMLINLLIWILIPLLIVLLVLVAPLFARRRVARLREGAIVSALITGMGETGTYVNEQPLVRFTLQFEDEGQMREAETKKVMSLVSPLRVGDWVPVSYDRRRKKATILTEEERRQM